MIPQEKIDALLKLNGDDEFVIYLAPVGVPEFSDSMNRIF